jgi:CRISPR-associated protein Cmr2
MKHLFLFTLGPVQSFIAQARKTQDLYAGSTLLSDLIKKAIEASGVEQPIFPKIGDSMPNRFLVEIPGGKTDLQAYGQKVEDAVRLKWKNIADRAWEHAIKKIKGAASESKPMGYDQQIATFLEIFWVIEALPSEADFKETLAKMEKNLAAIKNVRPFSQYDWQGKLTGEQGRKCSLDGQRNVLFFKPYENFQKPVTQSPLYTTEGSVLSSSGFPANMIQAGEGLSAVSFVKRNYNNSRGFESTAEIALLDALCALKQDDTGSKNLTEFQQFFAPDDFNPQFYFEEGLSDSFLKKQDIFMPTDIDEIRKFRKKKLEDYAKNKLGYKFQKYYTVLTFDGDNMGKWLSGEHLKDHSHLKDFQQAFADCLNNFAEKAKNGINNNAGRTVYAGGDDFLGFLNLNHLLPQLKQLRNLFDEMVNQPLSTFKKDPTQTISFSAGICVAHYKEPLSLVLQEARKAQQAAKNLDNKDAFAIHVLKGSGESHTTVLPFGQKAANVQQVKTIVDALIAEDFSTNYINTLQRGFERVETFDGDRQIYGKVMATETKRLLMRSVNKKWSKEKKKEKSEAMALKLEELFNTPLPHPHLQPTNNFFQLLHIADFFHREMDTPQ